MVEDAIKLDRRMKDHRNELGRLKERKWSIINAMSDEQFRNYLKRKIEERLD
jgi:hypothetical protein